MQRLKKYDHQSTFHRCFIRIKILFIPLYTSLVYLDLSDNKIGYDTNTIPANTFTYTISLRYLNLSDNSLQTLPNGIFSGMTELRYLDLSKNNIYYMNVNLFATMPSLVYLDMTDNDCDYAPSQCGGDPAPTFVLQTCHCN